MTGKHDEDIVLHVNNTELPLRLSVHPRARRLSLRVDPIQGCVLLVKPKRESKSAAIAFALEKADWIADSLADLRPPIPFEEGAKVPVLGEPHVIRHVPDARRGVWRDDGSLFVSGKPEHVPRRTRDWLRDEAKRTITPIAHELAGRLRKSVVKVSVRDTRSRWGSCTADGRLSFSWRLVMAPEFVLHYVVAHEVSHLAVLNHSPEFWRTVESLTDERQRATRWLKADGRELYRYGLNS